MSASGRASEFMQAWGEGHNKAHNPGHKAWGADDCDACTADTFDPWEALVHAARVAGFLRDEQGRTVTAVPPPVPPEIVEKAAKAVARIFWEGRATNDDREYAEAVLAAVYGDIVEAARRDALVGAMEGNALARAVGWDDGYLRGRRDALTEAADRISGWDGEPEHGSYVEGRFDSARIVTDLMAATAPPCVPTASVSDQGADPRTPGTDGAQIAAEGRDDDDYDDLREENERLLALVAAQADQIAELTAVGANVAGMHDVCHRQKDEAEAKIARVRAALDADERSSVLLAVARAIIDDEPALDGTEATP